MFDIKCKWNYFNEIKNDFIKEVNEDLYKNFKKYIDTLEGVRININATKQYVREMASREAFIQIIKSEKNAFKEDTIKDFIIFMNPNEAHQIECTARAKIHMDYYSIEVLLKKYWIRLLKESLPCEEIKTIKDFEKHFNFLLQLPSLKTYGQHFWTLHSSHKGNPIYKEFYNIHSQNIGKDFPLINLKEVRINDTRWRIISKSN